MDNNHGIYSNDAGAISSYFQFYSKLGNQQNMLQDYVRTKSYFNAIQNNQEDFLNKKIMDFGTGSGILAIFAAAAGAEKVYAVEASNAVRWAKKLIEYHNFENKITLINKKVEDINIDEIGKVDTIVSEPLGIMLINERMLEGYLVARDKYIHPNLGFSKKAERCTHRPRQCFLFHSQMNSFIRNS
jgi:histone-arginine methyltransferase CARM1